MKMPSRFGFLHVLLVASLGIFGSHGSFNVSDLSLAQCRIAGVVLVTTKDNTYKFNLTTAESVCQQLGLTLASKAQVQAAQGYGLETCSYGWVSDQTAVISRIHHNEKCGKNQTGVLTWTVDISRKFQAYCFNTSDTWKNSCKPEFATTSVPVTETQSSTGTELSPNETSMTWTTSPPWLSHHLPTTSSQSGGVTSPQDEGVTSPQDRGVTSPKNGGVTSSQNRVTSPTDLLETEITPESQTTEGPRKEGSTHKGDTFGSLPAALLTLALLFFSVAVVLGVCYIKKYKTNMLFTKKEEEKEAVETKVFKENKDKETPKPEDPVSNEKGAEDAPANALKTGNCMEAEV